MTSLADDMAFIPTERVSSVQAHIGVSSRVDDDKRLSKRYTSIITSYFVIFFFVRQLIDTMRKIRVVEQHFLDTELRQYVHPILFCRLS